jgi:hypothetical protein
VLVLVLALALALALALMLVLALALRLGLLLLLPLLVLTLLHPGHPGAAAFQTQPQVLVLPGQHLPQLHNRTLQLRHRPAHAAPVPIVVPASPPAADAAPRPCPPAPASTRRQ